MVQVFWKTLSNWAGAATGGTDKFELTNEEDKKNHMMRALWLTAQVEGGGKFGCINSYDGAGLTAGLDQKIAIYPKPMTQGSLWVLLKKMVQHSPCVEIDNLLTELKKENMGLMKDGSLRHTTTGALVPADKIRNLFAPPGGRTPKTGPEWEQAKKWATLFHEAFANPITFKVQVDEAISDLISGGKSFESAAYKATVGVEHPSVLTYEDNINAEHDLAWCVYHSFSVNAPGKARERLQASNPDNSQVWSKRIIRVLGTTKYGRWHDTVDGANRYDRTRAYAMNSGLWPNSLFVGPTAIMPRDFG
jgi:hypothetical protein